ncbi:MAG: extensin-like domain-containing protein [Bauldia sp.]
MANPFVVAAAEPVPPGEPAGAGPAAAAAPAVDAPAIAFVAPPGATEPPPPLTPLTAVETAATALPGVTMLNVHPQAAAGGMVDPVPLNLPEMLAALGQTNAPAPAGAGAPLGFAPANAPLAGPAGAINDLLRGGLDAPVGALVADTAPLPRSNPLALAERVQVAALGTANPFVPPSPSRQRDNACMSQLASLALIVTVLPPVNDGACGIATPVDLAQLGTGRNAVTLTPDATVDCHVVGALDAWMDESVQAAAARLFGQSVTSLRVAASYACRGVNNDPTAELSEHAFGRAIDISAFQFADGTWLDVHAAAEGTPEAEFLGAIRADACGPFTTVLGPGVANHADHFHFDLAVRGRNGDALYCR